MEMVQYMQADQRNRAAYVCVCVGIGKVGAIQYNQALCDTTLLST